VRGSRDFESRSAWQLFVDDVMRKANRGRGRPVAEDMQATRRLPEPRRHGRSRGEFSGLTRPDRCGSNAPERCYDGRVRWLFLTFTLLPIVDLWLLLTIGGALGFWPTVAMTVTSAALGAWLAKREGKKILGQWRKAMQELRMPEDGLVSGVLVVVGAALLAAPGVLTDVVGLLLLFPATRRLIAPVVRRRIEARIDRARTDGSLRMQVMGFGGSSARPPPGGPDADGFRVREVVDVEAEVEDEPPRQLPPRRA